MSLKLRDYQLDLFERTRRVARKSPIVCLATGGGKTAIAARILAGAAQLGNPSLVLAHTRELVHQTADKYRSYGIECGVLMGRERPGNEPTIVASIQTLARRQRPIARVVCVDEAHRSAGDTYMRAIEEYRADGAAVVGFTATPERLDGKGLGSVGFGEIVMGPTHEWLFEHGWLLKPKVFAPSRPDMTGVHKLAGDYALDEAADRVIVGDVAAHWAKFGRGKRSIYFAVSIEHSKALALALSNAGARVAHLDGTPDSPASRPMLSALASGDLEVITNCSLFGEGIDVPRLDLVGGCRPTLSRSLWFQQIGRVMRPSDGKERPIVLDHSGNTERLGLPWDPIEWTLEGRAKGRNAPAILGVKTCPSCFCVSASATAVCPECGHEWENERLKPRHVDGELVEIDERAARRIGDVPNMRAIVQRYIVDFPNAVNGFSESDVYAFASAYCDVLRKGYKDGYASMRFNRRTGQWPPGDFANLRLRLMDAAKKG